MDGISSWWFRSQVRADDVVGMSADGFVSLSPNWIALLECLSARGWVASQVFVCGLGSLRLPYVHEEGLPIHRVFDLANSPSVLLAELHAIGFVRDLHADRFGCGH